MLDWTRLLTGAPMTGRRLAIFFRYNSTAIGLTCLGGTSFGLLLLSTEGGAEEEGGRDGLSARDIEGAGGGLPF